MAQKNVKQSTNLNTLFHGDNLSVLKTLPSESVDLCYIDPPFFTNKNYSAVVKGKLSALDWNDNKNLGFFDSSAFFENQISSSEKGLQAYLTWIRLRLIEIHRVLKKTGSIYVHLDYHASHYIKIILDEIFSYTNFKNEIIWKRKQGSNATGRPTSLSNNSDTILFYSKSSVHVFNPIYLGYSEEYIKKNYKYIDANGDRYTSENMRAPSYSPSLVFDYKGYKPHPNGWCVSRQKMKMLDDQGLLLFPKDKDGRIRRKNYLKDRKGVPLTNIWDDIGCLQGNALEKLTWPTQKPVDLIKRIIELSSNEGDVVLDCFSGSGTTLHAAKLTNRDFIGIEHSAEAVAFTVQRFKKMNLKLNVVSNSKLKEKQLDFTVA